MTHNFTNDFIIMWRYTFYTFKRTKLSAVDSSLLLTKFTTLFHSNSKSCFSLSVSSASLFL